MKVNIFKKIVFISCLSLVMLNAKDYIPIDNSILIDLKLEKKFYSYQKDIEQKNSEILDTIINTNLNKYVLKTFNVKLSNKIQNIGYDTIIKIGSIK